MNGGFSIVFLYVTEVYDTELRVVGLGVANTAGRFFTSGCSYLFYYLVDESQIAVFVFIAFYFSFAAHAVISCDNHVIENILQR